MQTVAIINAGLGDLSIGFQLAGFKIIAAYESDSKASALHKANFYTPVYPFLYEDFNADYFPEVDLLVARLVFSKHPSKAKMQDFFVKNLLHILRVKRIKVFFFLINKTAIRNEYFKYFLSEIRETGYNFSFNEIDIAEKFGFPVKEIMSCVAGAYQGYGDFSEIPFFETYSKHFPEEYLQLNQPIDDWYTNIDYEKLPLYYDNRHIFFCWKKGIYSGTDQIQWNNLKIPLVRDGHTIRKITHREVANLKGFPSAYIIGNKYKSWLYQKLMYSGNVVAIKCIADALLSFLSGNLWRSRENYFKDLFGKFLKNLIEQEISFSLFNQKQVADDCFDFSIQNNNQILYFELKDFRGRNVAESKLRDACRSISSYRKGDGVCILVVANEVSNDCKAIIQKEFDVHIWDVSNLLWLFSKFPDINSEFIALLDYTVDSIDPQKPFGLSIYQDTVKIEQEKLGWKERLESIKTGKEQFKEYETICIDILKYVLGNYLTLWETQEQSNGGLYRFDMCCKIKNGADKDFFDTIKHYFRTKYIVFEFKNYKDKISQKEIYTTEKYLYEKALRKVAVIISRFGADENALQAARGSLRENGKLILCLSDSDLLEMIKLKDQGDQDPVDFLGSLLDELLVHLEK